jgi:hypothetical protein
MPSPRRVKKSVRRSKNKSPVKKACKSGKIRSPKTGRCIKDPSLKKKKSPVKKPKSPCKSRKMRSPKTGRCIKDHSLKKLKKKFSEKDIENLMRDAPDMRDKKDGAIIKKRLRKFVYDPSYESQYFRHDENRSLEENMYFQAAARLAEYGKGYLYANEI